MQQPLVLLLAVATLAAAVPQGRPESSPRYSLTPSASEGQCPVVAPKKPFDITQMLGEWKVVETLPSGLSAALFSDGTLNEKPLSCLQLDLQRSTNPHRMQAKVSFVLQGEQGLEEGEVILSNYGSPASWLGLWARGLYPLDVLASDYSSWALVHMCLHVHGGSRRQALLVLAKEAPLHPQVLSTLYTFAEGIGINAASLVSIDHSSCHRESSIDVAVQPESVQ